MAAEEALTPARMAARTLVGRLFALTEVQKETARLDRSGELYKGHPIFAEHDRVKALYEEQMEIMRGFDNGSEKNTTEGQEGREPVREGESEGRGKDVPEV